MSALLKTIVADYSATAGTINTVNQVSDCELQRTDSNVCNTGRCV